MYAASTAAKPKEDVKCCTATVCMVLGCTLLSIQAILLAWSARVHSPTTDEIAYLPAGISHWTLGRFELYRANPPLVRMVAAIPVLVAGHNTDWRAFDGRPGHRTEFAVGRDFIGANGDRSFHLFTWARWSCIPFTLLGGFVCWRWATELYGHYSGLFAVALWCFCPNVLGTGALITPDAATTSLGVTASYAFWRWLKSPEWSITALAGAALGLAEIAKTNWIILFILWPIIWISVRAWWYTWPERRTVIKELSQLITMNVIAVFVINSTYNYDGACKRLGDFDFTSNAFRDTQDGSSFERGRPLRNRFRNSWLGHLPTPLPEQYVLGIDAQRHSVEVGGMAFLYGTWKHHGWWYYYLAAASVKIPLGTVFILGLATYSRCKGYRGAVTCRDDIVLLSPVVGTLIFVSSQTGMNQHFRYMLPIFPFLFIWASSLVYLSLNGLRPFARLAMFSLIWASTSSLFVYPHSLSYFNEVAGGPRGGPYYLQGSNSNWGQDLLYLKAWIDNHPQASPLTLSWHGNGRFLDPRIVGIDYPRPPRNVPRAGWHIISVNHVHGNSKAFHYFKAFEPVDVVGYTMNVYYLTDETVDNWMENHR